MKSKWILLFVILVLIPGPGLAQGLFTDSTVTPFCIVEEMPKYPGGERKMYRFLSKNIEYPNQAKRDSVTGTVHLQFVISETGKVENIEVIKGVRTDLDNAAVDVVERMPRWKPGRQRGKPVPVFFNLPITFSLN